MAACCGEVILDKGGEQGGQLLIFDNDVPVQTLKNQQVKITPLLNSSNARESGFEKQISRGHANSIAVAAAYSSSRIIRSIQFPKEQGLA